MSAAEYVPQVGDRVQNDCWTADEWAEVRAIEGGQMWLRWPNGDHETFYVDRDWTKVETPRVWPEAWINVYPSCVSNSHFTREGADTSDARTPDKRIGVIHLAADGTVTLEAL